MNLGSRSTYAPLGASTERRIFVDILSNFWMSQCNIIGVHDQNSEDQITRLVKQGTEAHESGAHTEEVGIWKEVAVLDPEHPYWQANLAHAFALIGNDEQAAILFEHVISTAPHVSQAYNNYAALLANKGVPLQQLFPLFVMAVETSETYEHYQRHLINICLVVALSDASTHDDDWARIQEKAIEFLIRVQDRTPEHEGFVIETTGHFRQYRTLQTHMANQDWDAAKATLDVLESRFAAWEHGANEVARIERFRPLIAVASLVFQLLSTLGSDSSLTPAEFVQNCAAVIELQKQTIPHAQMAGTLTFLDIIGWCTAELRRQIIWLTDPAQSYDADAHRVPNKALRQLAETQYSEIVEMFQGLLLQTNRIIRRAADAYGSARGSVNRGSIVEKAWLAIRVATHGSVGEYSGLNEVIGREMLGWNTTPLDRMRRDLQRFKSFVEAQGHADMYIHGKPHENVGRALLQAFLVNNGFREVPVRGGRVDILIVERDAAFVIETKIWRGAAYHDDGLVELAEYVSNNSIRNLAGAFYVVFDPTATLRANAHLSSGDVQIPGIETVSISIALPTPSKKGQSQRTST